MGRISHTVPVSDHALDSAPAPPNYEIRARANNVRSRFNYHGIGVLQKESASERSTRSSQEHSGQARSSGNKNDSTSSRIRKDTPSLADKFASWTIAWNGILGGRDTARKAVTSNRRGLHKTSRHASARRIQRAVRLFLHRRRSCKIHWHNSAQRMQRVVRLFLYTAVATGVPNVLKLWVTRSAVRCNRKIRTVPNCAS